MVSAIILRQGSWLASRWGIQGELLNPLTHKPESARNVIATLHNHVRDALVEAGDEAYVKASLHRIFSNGTGAKLQRQAYARHGRLADVVSDAVVVTHQEPAFYESSTADDLSLLVPNPVV